MLRNFALLICAAMTVAASGCNKSAGPGDGKPAAAQNKPSAHHGGGAGPDAAVAEFLDALRSGDNGKVSAMLTSLARQKIAEAKLAVGVPVSDKASFKVGEVEFVAEDGAHVSSTWSDVDEEGSEYTDEIIWILRHETGLWRVVGMAMKVFEDELPVIINYEDPEDMIRKQALVEEEMARRESSDSLQAKRQADAPK